MRSATRPDRRAAVERVHQRIDDRVVLQAHAAESAGQHQRVALARLLTCAGTLWVLDEPFPALDTYGVAIMDTLLHQHVEAGGAAVIASRHPVALDRVIPKLIRIDAGR